MLPQQLEAWSACQIISGSSREREICAASKNQNVGNLSRRWNTNWKCIWTRRANSFNTPQTPFPLASNLHPKPVTMTFAMLRWTSGLNKTRRCHSPLPEDGALINFNSTSARRHFKDAPQKIAGQQEWTLEAQTHLNHGLETIGWRTF